jgi:hypothetical protein
MPHKVICPDAEYKRDSISFVDYVGNAANNRLSRGSDARVAITADARMAG